MQVFNSKMSTKGQVIVPKELCEKIDLQSGDNVTFTLNEDGKVLFAREFQLNVCPVCQGNRVIADKSEPCFVCAEKGHVDRNRWTNEILHNASRYKINVTITQQFWDEREGRIVLRDHPKIEIISPDYTRESLDFAQDHLQMEMIRRATPTINGRKSFPHLVDEYLEKLLEYLVNDWAKEEVRGWFRPKGGFPTEADDEGGETMKSLSLSGSVGTGEKILDNWKWFRYEKDDSKSDDNFHQFNVSFGGQSGYFNYRIEDGKITSATMDMKFPKTLGSYNDASLLRLARRIHG